MMKQLFYSRKLWPRMTSCLTCTMIWQIPITTKIKRAKLSFTTKKL